MKEARMDVEMYERALNQTGEVVRNTSGDQLGDSTPCTEWDVRALLNHVIAGCVTFAAGGSGERVEMTSDTDHLGQDHVDAYERAAKSALEAFSAPGALERNFALPWGDTPGSAALGIALADATVHGWDLAKATGQPATIDDDIAESLYQMVTQMLAPKGSFPRQTAFKEPVVVGEDASSTDKLLAYLGRRP
jgi:uncharacterized protein (TIGR03086 family)